VFIIKNILAYCTKALLFWALFGCHDAQQNETQMNDTQPYAKIRSP